MEKTARAAGTTEKNGRGKKPGRGEGTPRKSEGVRGWEHQACAYGGLGYGITIPYPGYGIALAIYVYIYPLEERN
jgi:hypothetical protein